jgi:carboxymethylenebutenolidase
MRFRSLVPSLGLPLVAAVFLAACMSAGSPASRIANVDYPAPDGTILKAYLVLPEGTGPFPGVVMIHEWWGLDTETREKADRLSRHGFAVLAVDAYRGRSADTVPGAIMLVSTTPRERIAADVDAGWSYLTGLPQVDRQRVGAVGFCFGGTQTMLLGVRNAKLKAAVIFYGSGPITDPTKLGHLGEGGPVLGIFGDKDSNIPTKDALAFGAAMKTKGISSELTMYGGQGHAFVKADAIDEPGASRDAWNQMVDFLVNALRPAG